MPVHEKDSSVASAAWPLPTPYESGTKQLLFPTAAATEDSNEFIPTKCQNCEQYVKIPKKGGPFRILSWKTMDQHRANNCTTHIWQGVLPQPITREEQCEIRSQDSGSLTKLSAESCPEDRPQPPGMERVIYEPPKRRLYETVSSDEKFDKRRSKSTNHYNDCDEDKRRSTKDKNWRYASRALEKHETIPDKPTGPNVDDNAPRSWDCDACFTPLGESSRVKNSTHLKDPLQTNQKGNTARTVEEVLSSCEVYLSTTSKETMKRKIRSIRHRLMRLQQKGGDLRIRDNSTSTFSSGVDSPRGNTHSRDLRKSNSGIMEQRAHYQERKGQLTRRDKVSTVRQEDENDTDIEKLHDDDIKQRIEVSGEKFKWRSTAKHRRSFDQSVIIESAVADTSQVVTLPTPDTDRSNNSRGGQSGYSNIDAVPQERNFIMNHVEECVSHHGNLSQVLEKSTLKCLVFCTTRLDTLVLHRYFKTRGIPCTDWLTSSQAHTTLSRCNMSSESQKLKRDLFAEGDVCKSHLKILVRHDARDLRV